MTGIPIITAGDGKLHTLSEKGYKSDPQQKTYQVTLMCTAASILGVANANGIAVGVDNELIVWLAPGDSITHLTRDLQKVCWQDVSGASSTLSISIEAPFTYTSMVAEN